MLLAWSLVCLALPVPSFLRDFGLGGLVVHSFYSLFNWLLDPGPPEEQKPLLIPDFSTLPILKVPAAKEYCPISRYEVPKISPLIIPRLKILSYSVIRFFLSVDILFIL